MLLHFLFSTWLGGVVCSAIALAVAGPIILSKINQAKNFAKKEAAELKEKLHRANQSAHQQNQNRP